MKLRHLMPILALVLALAMIVSGCGSSADQTADTDTAADTAASTADTAAAADTTADTAADAAAADFTTVTDGVLTMATNVAFPPYEYYENDQAVGIDVEIAQAIADKLGLTLQIEDMEFGSIIGAVSTNKVDIGVGAITITDERKESVNFTMSYATGIQSVIVKDGSAIASVDDLYADGADYMIGVQQDTTGDIYATDDFGDEHIMRYNKGADAVQALVSGKVDCVIIDNAPAEEFVSANEGLKLLDSAYANEDYGICLNKDNEALLTAVNGALQSMMDDGTIDGIISKYISADTDTGASDETAAADFTTVTDGVLTMATNVAFPPYEYYENDQAVGIDVEIAQAIADKLGLTLQIEDMEFGSIIGAVSTNKVDIGVGAITITDERKQSVNFTTSYATGVQSVIVAEGSPITSVDDLYADGADYMIGVQQDTTGDIYATDDFGDDHIMRYNKGADAVQALVSGKVDCVIIDNAPAQEFVAANEGLKLLDSSYADEDYGICLNKDNEALLTAVNGALQSMMDDGTIDGILAKYISAD